MEQREYAREILRGGYDLHVHSAPSHAERCVNDVELLRQADRLEMAGVIIKNHFEPTEARAAICNLAVQTKFSRAYGSITLNYPVGGINPAAVESAARLGARMVWMPTCEARNDLLASGRPTSARRPGITILDERGRLIPEIYEIFEIAKQYHLTIGTGHISLEEIEILCKEGRRAGVQMSFTHPEWRTVRAPLPLQKELSRMGVLIEKAWVPVPLGDATAEELAESIRQIGAGHVYLVTDHGAGFLKAPGEAMLDYISALLEQGVSEKELEIMLKEIPRTIVEG